MNHVLSFTAVLLIISFVANASSTKKEVNSCNNILTFSQSPQASLEKNQELTDALNGLSPEKRAINDILVFQLEALSKENFFCDDMPSKVLNATQEDLENFADILFNHQIPQGRHSPSSAIKRYTAYNILQQYFSENLTYIDLPTLKAWARNKEKVALTEKTEQPNVFDQITALNTYKPLIMAAFKKEVSEEKMKKLLSKIPLEQLSHAQLTLVAQWFSEAGHTLATHAAAYYMLTDYVQAFVDKLGMDINDTDKDGDTLLMLSVRYEDENTTTYLVNHPKIEINKKNPLTQYTALNRAQKHTVVEILLTHKDILVNQSGNWDTAILLYAVVQSDLELISLLLADPRVDVNYQGKAALSPLMLAAEKGDSHVIDLLLSHEKILINQKNIHGQTALMYALMWKRNDSIRLFLAHKDILLDQTPTDPKKWYADTSDLIDILEQTTDPEIKLLIQWRIDHPNATKEELESYYFKNNSKGMP